MTSKHLGAALALIAAALALPGSASAALIVAPGSTYQLYIAGADSGSTYFGLTFDGQAESFIRTFADGSTLFMTLSERQQDLGNGHWSIGFTVEGAGDLFPATDESAYVNIGLTSDPLDLLASNLQLNSAVLTFEWANGDVFGSADFVQYAVTPWDGYFTQGFAHGFTQVGNHGVTRVSWAFDVSTIQDATVAEPTSALLALLGLGGLVVRRRTGAAVRRD